MNNSIQGKAEGLAGEAWFLAQTSGQAERLAKAHLERQGFAVYLPMRATLSKRVDAQRAVPFLPRYLFVGVDEAAPRWHDIVATPGVTALVRRAGAASPARLPRRLLDAIREREVYGLVTLAAKEPNAVEFKRGEAVRVDLPMRTDEGSAAFDALFEAVIDARRVALLLSFADRMVRVEVARGRVRKAA